MITQDDKQREEMEAKRQRLLGAAVRVLAETQLVTPRYSERASAALARAGEFCHRRRWWALSRWFFYWAVWI